MSYPILYSFRRCPFAIRSRMALAKAGIICEHREVNLKNKPDEMLTISNKGTVPVLVLENGDVIDESLDIMVWALHQNDPDHWLNTNIQQALQLINENDFEFKPELDRYKYHIRYPQYSQQHYREQAEHLISKLDTLLKKKCGTGFIDETPTLADVAIFPFIRQFAGVDRKWFEGSSFSDLVVWLQRIEHGEDFLSVMQKYDFWIPNYA